MNFYFTFFRGFIFQLLYHIFKIYGLCEKYTAYYIISKKCAVFVKNQFHTLIASCVAMVIKMSQVVPYICVVGTDI